MLTLIIGILITIVLGAILFWIIDKFCPEARLAQLLQAVSGSGLFGVDRHPDAATAWLSVTSLIALTIFAPHIVGENLTRP